MLLAGMFLAGKGLQPCLLYCMLLSTSDALKQINNLSERAVFGERSVFGQFYASKLAAIEKSIISHSSHALLWGSVVAPKASQFFR
jgi:hypothetical protein